MLNANSPEVQNFLAAWHMNDLQVKGSTSSATKVVREGRRYLHLNYQHANQTMGHFMCDRETAQVYSIKGYGRPNKQKPRGKIEFLTSFIEECTKKNIDYTHDYWYALHPTE